MPARRFVSALKDLLLRAGEITTRAPEVVPPPPAQIDPPAAWRAHRVTRGPYTRFRVHAPRDWLVRQADGADLLHIEPPGRGWTSGGWPAVGAAASPRAVSRPDLPAVRRSDLGDRGISGTRPSADLAITLSWQSLAVYGPQGLLDALESVVAGPIPAFERGAVLVDRWGEDAWVASWAWHERGNDGEERAFRVVVFGHDEGAVTAMVHGDAADVAANEALCEELLGTVRLSPAVLLSPESFPPTLCELLNERAAGIRAPFWDIDEQGALRSSSLTVRIGSLYRAYLRSGDLEGVAGLVDAHPRGTLERRWGGLGWSEVSEHVRVVLRRAEAVRDLGVVAMALPGGLVACPVLDTGDHMTFIPSGESDRWGLDVRELVTNAVARLDREDPAVVIEAADAAGMPRGLLLAAEDGYDSGRLLCPRFRESLEEALGGALLVAMPSAWAIHIWRDTPAARLRLGDLARQGYLEEPTPLSETLWTWDEGGLVPVP